MTSLTHFVWDGGAVNFPLGRTRCRAWRDEKATASIWELRKNMPSLAVPKMPLKGSGVISFPHMNILKMEDSNEPSTWHYQNIKLDLSRSLYSHVKQTQRSVKVTNNLKRVGIII